MLISNFDPASAKTVQEWITAVGAMPTIEPGSPWKMATSTASMRDEVPNGEILLREAQILVESCPRRAEEQSSLERALFSLA